MYSSEFTRNQGILSTITFNVLQKFFAAIVLSSYLILILIKPNVNFHNKSKYKENISNRIISSFENNSESYGKRNTFSRANDGDILCMLNNI